MAGSVCPANSLAASYCILYHLVAVNTTNGFDSHTFAGPQYYMRFENVKLKIHLLTIGSTAIKNRLWIQITHKDRYIDTYSITIQIFVIIS